MEKEKTMLATMVDPKMFQLFKATLQYRGITISDWLEVKIMEEAKTIIINEAE